MALRDLVGGAARLSAGVWKEVANVVDPQPVVPPEAPSSQPAEPLDVEPEEADEVSTPAGTILVPLDSWTRVLEQLGNLHQAGQDLAEARERAAKAETEAKFLREQLAEARAKKKSPTKPKAMNPPKVKPAPEPAREPSESGREVGALRQRGSVLSARAREARRRASAWLAPNG